MADPTRFDLSRLEGCTGTVTEARVAVPHALRPTRAQLPTPSKKPPGTADASPPQAVPDCDAQECDAAPPENIPEPSAQVSSSHDRKLTRAAPVAPAAPEIEAVPSAEESTPDRERENVIPVGIILALTLAAWVPVLILWSARLG